MSEAFQYIGVDVRHIGPERDNGIAGLSAEACEKYRWHTQGDWHQTWADWTPDVILYAETLCEQWHHDGYPDVPHIHYNTAGAMERPMNGMAHTFTAVSWGGIWQATDKVSWLPCAYNKALCKPSRIPWSERKYDVVMIGRLDDQRLALLHELEAAGIACHYASGLIYDEYVKAYHNGRMALIQINLHHVPIRLFEAPALGCLPLTPWYPEYSLLEVDGVMVFDEHRAGAVVEAAQFALQHPSWSIQMIEKARRWGLHHTWIDRAKKIVEWWEYEQPSKEPVDSGEYHDQY